MKLVISCEHAVNTVPETYQYVFKGQEALLNTHRAIDFGALNIARHLSQVFSCDFIQAEVTRLLIDCNRSLAHSQCFSVLTEHLAAEVKQDLVINYYLPFRNKTEQIIDQYISANHQVLHLSVHSFTPVLNGIIRDADMGLLYDPARTQEKNVAKAWRKHLLEENPNYRIRMNYPYLGISDGFTTTLRRKYKEACYLGLELENNQRLVQNEASLSLLCQDLSSSLEKLLRSFNKKST